MSELFARGYAADFVLLVMLGEAAWLMKRHRWGVIDTLTLLLPGALILLALRAALTHQDWRWVALPLIVSLPVHLADVGRRFRVSVPPVSGGQSRAK